MRSRRVLLAAAVRSRRRWRSGCGPKVKPGLTVAGDKADGEVRSPDGRRRQAGRPGRRSAVAHEARGARESSAGSTRRRSRSSPTRRCRVRRSSRWRCPPGRRRSTASGWRRRSSGRSRPSACTSRFAQRPGKWATRDQRIAVAFNQPVRAQRRREALRLRLRRAAAWRRSSTTPARPKMRARSFAVLPHEPLALATKWRFECSPELTGAEGPLGLEVDAKRRRRARVRDLRPVQGHVGRARRAASSRPTTSASRSPSRTPLDVEARRRCRSRSSRRSTGFPERAAVVDDRVTFSARALQPNTRYTITVDAGIADRFGQRLPGQHVASFGTGDGTPRLDVETGAWVVEASRPGYPAWSRNLTKHRGRRRRGPRGEARRAVGPAQLVGRGRRRRRRSSGSRPDT